ncbi:MAG: hypothetical protein Q4G44_08165 [Alcaligenaceae bacterium]|nr:hypothetical protein [Alcaligenaceae bacterium]
MSSPVLNRVWCQTLRIEPSSYEIFYKTALIWVGLLLTFGFLTACLLSSLLFVFFKDYSSKTAWGLSLSPEGECRYYPDIDQVGIVCQPVFVRHALFWCHLVMQAEDGKRYQLVIWLHRLQAQEKRRFNALCHNWSQEILA